MGVLDTVKGFIKGDKPVEFVEEVGKPVGDITGDITEVPSTPVEAPIEPAFTELLNEPEKEEVNRSPSKFSKRSVNKEKDTEIPMNATGDAKIDWVDETVEFIPPEKKDKKRKKEPLTFEIDGGMSAQPQTPPIPNIPVPPIQTPPVTPPGTPPTTPPGTPPTTPPGTPPTTPPGTPPTTPPTTPPGTPPTTPPGTPPTTPPGTPPTTPPGTPVLRVLRHLQRLINLIYSLI